MGVIADAATSMGRAVGQGRTAYMPTRREGAPSDACCGNCALFVQGKSICVMKDEFTFTADVGLCDANPLDVVLTSDGHQRKRVNAGLFSEDVMLSCDMCIDTGCDQWEPTLEYEEAHCDGMD